MIPILTPEQMRNADATAIEHYGIASAILMENAARSSAEIMKKLFSKFELVFPKVSILCGSGNNGGDGFALARLLFDVAELSVFWIGKQDKMSPETLANLKAIEKIGILLVHLETEEDIDKIPQYSDFIVDSMIGVGGSENLKGLVVPILKIINQSQAFKIAIDAPTGLNTLTGKAFSDTFTSDLTITMYAVKTGMLINDGTDYCGNIEVAELGAPEFIPMNIADTFALERQDLQRILPERQRKSSKFDYGKVFVIAGSENYPGAAALTANAAIKSGAGLVYLASNCFHSAILPEVIPIQLPTTSDGSISLKAFDLLLAQAKKSDAIAIGPGLSANDETIELCKRLISQIPAQIPLIIDADGLRAIESNSQLRKNIVLTPHCGEFSRITNIERNQVEIQSLELAKDFAKKSNSVVLLKNVPTVISDGKTTYLNITGNPGMASGGCGDVLTGIIASLLAMKINAIDAASLGAFIHSRAGDVYIQNNPMETLTASDLLNHLFL